MDLLKNLISISEGGMKDTAMSLIDKAAGMVANTGEDQDQYLMKVVAKVLELDTNKLFKGDFKAVEDMVKAQLQEAAGRVHTIRKPGILPRGAPTEPARAFDKIGTNRSVIKKLNDKASEFYVLQGEVEWFDRNDPKNDEFFNGFSNYMMIHVAGGGIDADKISDYYGINVILPLKATSFELDDKQEAGFSTSDPIADKQLARFERTIVKTALDALKKDNIPGGMGGMGEHEYRAGGGVKGIEAWEEAQLSKLKDRG
jgi:hypothetical protein